MDNDPLIPPNQSPRPGARGGRPRAVRATRVKRAEKATGPVRLSIAFATPVLLATLLVAVLAPATRGLAAEGTAAGPAPGKGFRRLAPGALTVIPPDTRSDSQVLRDDIREVTKGLADGAWEPKFAPKNTTLVERAKNREFQRDIWCLEFAFKPPRLIDVDVPASGLKMQRKRVWYLVYRVKNVGGRRTVIDKDDPTKRSTESFETPIRFVPHFVLESLEGLSEPEGDTAYRGYLDRVIPPAIGPIRRREDPARELLDSSAMAAADIAPGEERWGVAVWEDVDPRIDFFTITVRGLTNAVRWRERPGAAFKPDDPGAGMDRTLVGLRLDFWRPGDDREQVGEMSVGYAGMFERMTLGGKLVDALARPGMVKSRPVLGLADLGLTWPDLVVSADGGGDLAPLAKVVRKIDAVKEPTARGPLVRALLGDLGVEYFEQVSRALLGPTTPEREGVRRQALAAIQLTPEAAAARPLDSLAKVVDVLDDLPPGPKRQAREREFFGDAAGRVGSLAKDVAIVRTLAALETLDVNVRQMGSGDGLTAFDAVRPAVEAQQDVESRKELLEALFGPRGPALYDRATAVREGIDHTWDLRYEIDTGR